MKKALQIAKWLLILLLGFVATIFITAQFLPTQTNITRKIVIDKPVGIPFAQIGIFSEWYDWSTWDLIDPAITRSDDGKGLTVGHHREWNSPVQGGKGWQTITAIDSNKQIKMDIAIGENGVAHEIFNFKALDSTKTEIAWTMEVPHTGTIERVFGYFFFEKMIAPDFENGLKNLKAKCEKM